jgi:hypothetical protein
MIRKRTILSLALLASTAACGGGGSSGGGGTASAGSSPGSSPATAVTLPSTNFQSPSVVMAADGTTTMAADQTSQTYTQDGAGTTTDPRMLHVNINAGGIKYQNDYDLTNVKDPTTAAFANSVFVQAAPTTNPDGSTVVFDVTLSSSAYGIWQLPNGQIAAFASGTDTPVADIPQTGTATYKGNSIGGGQTGGNAFTLVGDFNGTLNFASRNFNAQWNMTAQNAAGDQAALQVNTNQAMLAANSNKISGTIGSTTTSAIIPTALNGSMTASLFGPGAAEIGGVGNLAGGNTSAVFAFGGKK